MHVYHISDWRCPAAINEPLLGKVASLMYISEFRLIISWFWWKETWSRITLAYRAPLTGQPLNPIYFSFFLGRWSRSPARTSKGLSLQKLNLNLLLTEIGMLIDWVGVGITPRSFLCSIIQLTPHKLSAKLKNRPGAKGASAWPEDYVFSFRFLGPCTPSPARTSRTSSITLSSHLILAETGKLKDWVLNRDYATAFYSLFRFRILGRSTTSRTSSTLSTLSGRIILTSTCMHCILNIGLYVPCSY